MEQFTYNGQPVPPFTLLGATTDPGKLPAPFRDRFGIDFTIDYYPIDEMLELAERSYRGLGGEDGKEVQQSLIAIAERARGTPRVVNRLLRRCMDFMIVRREPSLTEALVTETMTALGIDRFGMDPVDRKILVALYEINRPVGLASVASKIGEDSRTIELVHEPWLVREGYVERGQRGREASGIGKALAYEIIEGKVQW
jgi:Holliday junction DNA helicase RuvB